jgi:hypothetical protein
MAFVEGTGNDAEDRDSLYLVGLDVCPIHHLFTNVCGLVENVKHRNSAISPIRSTTNLRCISLGYLLTPTKRGMVMR